MALVARTVLVTGASRGLGLEFVQQIAKLPNSPEVLIAGCRNPASADKLKAIAESNPRVKIVKLDVEKDEDIEEAFQETKSLVGDLGLNLLINNAGLNDKSDSGGITTQTRERMQKHFDVNVSGPIMVAQKFLPLLQQAASHGKSGQLSCSKAGIVMMSSIMASQTQTATEGRGTTLHYKCSKTAMTMASIIMARELRDSGILVISMHPGWVRTDMGGPNADVLLPDSIAGCLKVIANADEAINGKLVTFSGEVLPY